MLLLLESSDVDDDTDDKVSADAVHGTLVVVVTNEKIAAKDETFQQSRRLLSATASSMNRLDGNKTSSSSLSDDFE
jgi:hypothetical protein